MTRDVALCVVDPTAFRHALLLGMSLVAIRIDTARPTIDRAYARCVLASLESQHWRVGTPAHARSMHYCDPIFGTYSEIDALLIEGLRSRIIELDSPGLVTARFIRAGNESETRAEVLECLGGHTIAAAWCESTSAAFARILRQDQDID